MAASRDDPPPSYAEARLSQAPSRSPPGYAEACRHPLRVLAIEAGGGVRGFAQLFMLDQIMEGARGRWGLPRQPRPCECFEVIGGSGCGGILAILLGRLQMTTAEAIEAYRRIALAAFKPRAGFRVPGRPGFDAEALEAELGGIIAERGLGEAMLDPDGEALAGARTVVLAHAGSGSGSAPRRKVFRSYGGPAGSVDDGGGTILEAARAAVSELPFPAPPRGEGAGSGAPDPRAWSPLGTIALEEAPWVYACRYGRAGEVSCSVVLGAGPPGRERDGADRRVNEVCRACDRAWGTIASVGGGGRAAADGAFSTDPKHMRFSPLRGFDGISAADWDKLDEVQEIVARYLERDCPMMSRALWLMRQWL